MKKLFQNIVAILPRKGLRRSPKSMRRKGLADGFTLIELLVASLIASFLVVVLLSFLVGVLDSDRKETAKSNAQEELQAAISYIADDLQEATYIYGSDALAGINSQLPHTQAGNECSDSNTCTPVLVFWKRYVYNPNSEAKYSIASASTDPSVKIGCMPYLTQTAASCGAGTTATAFGRDTYTTSLVAYYLKNDSDDATVSTWSKTARILRWEIKDGYVAYCFNGGAIGSTNCPETTKQTTRDGTSSGTSSNNSAISPAITDTTNYFIVPSKGFNRLDLSASGTASTLAGAWKKFDNFDLNTDKFFTLVDFMDDTAYSTAPTAGTSSDGNSAATGNGSTTTATIRIPIGKNNTITGVPSPTNLDCDNPSIGVGNASPASATTPTGTVTQRIPADFADPTSNPSNLSSFYACVSPDGVSGSTVRIFVRGNAIARLVTPAIDRDSRKPNDNNISFFPTADVRVFGRSAIGIKTK